MASVVAPADFEALKSEIAARREALPRRLKQVAAFALAEPDEMAFGTTARIAEHAGVQPSTLVRFAQTLGYQGFSELQRVFRARLKERFPDYRQRIEALREPGDASALTRLCDGFAGAARASLDRLGQGLDAAALERAVATLAAADTIHLVGARRVFPVAAYLAYAFGKLGVRAVLVDNVGHLGPEQAGGARPGDALLAISFTPYASSTIEAAQAAAARGVPVVAVTDSPFSPLAVPATVWLEVAEADYGAFRSLAATFALAMTLAVGTAERRGVG
ncbi:MurR/RpiR family transcriptional regulator [Prosthecomicrobium sp. N25]|uniref:MurR/RpiR family transcriptional regulator n=1 Tax=Prosthecomicrobium sp. N25 TaxID=3129254 RepID=UPI003077FD42